MPLTDRELTVISAKSQGLTEKAALVYLKTNGYQMSPKTYYNILNRIDQETLQRLYEVAKFQKERHRQRIDKLETVEKLLWENYHKETDPTKAARILDRIREMQVYLSAFDQGTAGVIEEVIKHFGKDPDSDESVRQGISSLVSGPTNQSRVTSKS